VILLDTSGVLAALFPDQRLHDQCARALREAGPRRILSPFVVAELDYLILKLAGVETEALFLEEIARGAYEIAEFRREDVAEARDIVVKYAALKLGIADASLLVLANRYRTRDILTLDQRHFRAVRILGRKTFRILPSDA
jgi:predicted nucleic acid-binding protein